jgi:hypothetical protein
LSQTTVYAPASGSVINLQLRPGSFVAGLPMAPVMSFVEEEYQVLCDVQSERAHEGRARQRGGDCAPDLPRSSGEGQSRLDRMGAGPGSDALVRYCSSDRAAALPPGRYAVKIDIAERDRKLFLAAGATGNAAIYTDHLAAIHIIRKVILRVGSYINYLILKLH